MWAFLMALKLGCPPLEVCTDYLGLVDGIADGEAECTGANRAHADLWRLVWEAIGDFGINYVTLRKVKAHVALTRILDGIVDCSWCDWYGNQVADSQAKLGAACHPVRTDMQVIVSAGRVLV